MKKLVLLVMVLLLAVPALANIGCPSDPGGCNVSFDVNVYKNKTICEFTKNDKFFFTFACIKLNPHALADCEVFKCDYNAYNIVSSYWGTYTDAMCSSFNGFEGIGQANQAAGYANNQGNVVGIAATEGICLTAAMTEVGVGQTNFFNTLSSCDDWSIAKINNSFNDFCGIGQANQAPGHMNNQNNVVAVSAGLGSGVLATNDTFLTQSNVLSLALTNYAFNSDSITCSFNDFCGIGQVNQSAGSMNNQANMVTVSFAGKR
jgi:hypothetical protein